MTRNRASAKKAGSSFERAQADWLAVRLNDDRIELQARKTLGGRGRVPDIELAERDRLAVLVQTMNKRGV